MLARYAMALCSPVRLSQASIQRYIETVEQIELVFGKIATIPSAYPTMCYKGIWLSSKIRVLPSGILLQTLKLADLFCFFPPRSSSQCCQLRSTVDVASLSH